MKNWLSVFFLFFTCNLFAQTSLTSGEIYLRLKKLNVLGTVLYVAAHPDDENTRLLAYFSKDRLYKTGYLSVTRGDGGQNLIGNEQGIELGLIRTQELLSARTIDGAEQFFTRAYDFGYSKTPDETFEKWNKEKVLADVVWIIRTFKPDVIITRFPVTGEGGHGHHTASAILANEAFIAAADPKRFPEQLTLTQPWQAKRILWNAFNFGSTNTTRDDQFKFDVGTYNAVLGKSYGEIAAESRSQHKSQGFGVPRSRGEALEYFSATDANQVQNDLFENINTTWSRVPGSSNISQLIDGVIKDYDFLNPQKSIPQLVQVYKSLRVMPESHWRSVKLLETQYLIEQASGMWIESFTSQPYAVHGDSLRIQMVVNDRLGVGAKIQSIKFEETDSVLQRPLMKNKNLVIPKTIAVKNSVPITQPYWLQNEMEEGYFNVTDQKQIGAAEIITGYKVVFNMEIGGEVFALEKPVKHKYTDPVKGELYQPLVILPSISLTPDEQIKLSVGKNELEGIITVKANAKNVQVKADDIALKQNDKPNTQIDPKTLSFSSGGSTQNVKYNISAAKDNQYYFSFTNPENKSKFSHQLHEIKYDHIPNITYQTPVVVKNTKIDLVTRGKRIGYIVGAGDKVPEALEQIGYEVVLMQEKELARNNLQQFDAIIAGVRAYNTNEWLNLYHDKLMRYVENGGNLIVQYNTSNQIGPVRAKIGPYPFNISRTRITDEKSKINFVDPAHQVLNFPNKITSADFNNWIQERSIYHAAEWDKNFKPVLSLSDPGEAAEDGSLIIARYGKGYFTYTGLVFFRQLPAGVPGAYRLIANLIALNQKKEM
jgi:LmbE family N-acetylglucosaminyl deacetylase